MEKISKIVKTAKELGFDLKEAELEPYKEKKDKKDKDEEEKEEKIEL